MRPHPSYCTCAANGFWAHFVHAKDCHMRIWLESELERSGIDVAMDAATSTGGTAEQTQDTIPAIYADARTALQRCEPGEPGEEGGERITNEKNHAR